MILKLCLLLLSIVGGLLAAVSPEPLGLQSLGGKLPIHYWLYSLKSFVVPLCLILATWKQRTLGRCLTCIWSGWLLTLSAIVILTMNEAAPSITLYGVILVTCILILALSILVFACMDLSRQRTKVILPESKAEQAPTQ